MNTPYDGGPAFPPACSDAAHAYALSKLDGVTDPSERDRIYIQAKAQAANGMSLRDWFAGQAITAASQAWLSATDGQRMALSGCEDTGIIFQRDFPRFIERVSGGIADAMLAARKRKSEGSR